MKNRKLHLEALLREAVKMLKEQDPGAAAVGSAVPPSPLPPASATNSSQTALPPEVPPPGVPPVPGTSPEEQKPFDVDQMIERLNVIRGGRSFADPEVYGQLTTYFKGLNEADRSAIDRFLQSIGKIVIQVNLSQTDLSGTAQAPMQQGVSPAPAAPVAPSAAPGTV